MAIALISGVAYAVSGSSKPEATVAVSPDSTTTTATATATATPEVARVKLPADDSWQWQGGSNGNHSLPNVFLADSTGKLTPLIGLLKIAADHLDFKSVTMKQLKDGSVLVTCGASYQVFHLGTAGKVREILDRAQFERLLHSDGSHFGLANYLNNQFYVQTTVEILTMDLTGKSVKTLEEVPDIVSLATEYH